MPESIAASYRSMGDTELLQVARSYDGLTDEAQSALRTEFAVRGLETPDAVDEPAAEYVRLVTVKRFRDLSEAIIARSMLESAGIVVYLFDENLVRLDWQLSNFIGGIRLQVAGADREAAIELLEQPVPEAIEYGDDETFDQPHCPVCNSQQITFEGASRTAPLVSLYLAALPLPEGASSWRCENCGSRWEDDSADAARAESA